MAKLSEIPEEQPREELATLPPENILLALKEEVKEAQPNKTGGLVITFKTREGKTFPQKYSKISGAALKQALKQMNYDGTEPLFKGWHHYVMTAFRTGFPRYIPDKKVR